MRFSARSANCSRISAILLPPAANSEDLFKLVEDQHRSQPVVARTPEMHAVEVLPQRLWLRAFCALSISMPLSRAAASVSAFTCSTGLAACGPVVEPQNHGKASRLAQPWKHAGPQQRCLSQARAPEQNRQRLALDEPQQFLVSASRPKKRCACSSVYQKSPGQGFCACVRGDTGVLIAEPSGSCGFPGSMSR
jgi:hypothetical protein